MFSVFMTSEPTVIVVQIYNSSGVMEKEFEIEGIVEDAVVI